MPATFQSMRLIVLAALIAVVMLLLQSSVYSAESSSPKGEPLILLRESLSNFDHVDLEATVHATLSSSTTATQFLRVKRHGSRALISWKEFVDRPGKETWRAQHDACVYGNGDVLQCQVAIDSSLKQVSGPANLALVLNSSRLAKSQEVDAKSVYYGLNDASAALWVIGYQSITDMLKNASSVQLVSRDAGAEVRAFGAYGRLKLVLSAANGWLPQSFELIKDPGHETVRGTVADVYKNSVTFVSWTGKVSDFTVDSAGRWAPARMTVERRTEWKDRPSEPDTTTIEFQRVTFDPALTEADFQTDIAAPVGYPVSIRGADHLPYRWDGVAAVPGIPDGAGRVEGYRGRGGLLQAILICINVALIAIVVFVLIWKKRRVQS